MSEPKEGRIYDGPATVEIMRNADRVVRSIKEADVLLSLWSLGNWACDCNRESFFARSIGEEAPGRKCGHDAFSIRITALDGRLMYSDGEFGFFDDDGKVPT